MLYHLLPPLTTMPSDPEDPFQEFFEGPARRHLFDAIALALCEDGTDYTSNAVFGPADTLSAEVVARQDMIPAGLPLIPIILQEALTETESLACECRFFARDGERVPAETVLAAVTGGARRILKAESVILNFLSHMSGIATVTARYVDAVSGAGITLLDTRKTMPGMRYPEKYAVLMGGARNHRKNLAEILMLTSNHIDLAGSITGAVGKLRQTHSPCPPIEVECRNEAEVREAVACGADWIMFDNMTPGQIASILPVVPETVTTVAAGGITLETIGQYAEAGKNRLTHISVGRLTHSAPAADCAMRIARN